MQNQHLFMDFTVYRLAVELGSVFFFCCGRGNSYHTENAAHAKYYYFYYYYYRYCYMRNLHAVENEEKQQKLFI